MWTHQIDCSRKLEHCSMFMSLLARSVNARFEPNLLRRYLPSSRFQDTNNACPQVSRPALDRAALYIRDTANELAQQAADRHDLQIQVHMTSCAISALIHSLAQACAVLCVMTDLSRNDSTVHVWPQYAKPGSNYTCHQDCYVGCHWLRCVSAASGTSTVTAT